MSRYQELKPNFEPLPRPLPEREGSCKPRGGKALIFYLFN
nr:MAG TPA: hypothetical protein [Caudoviricetes sp.]